MSESASSKPLFPKKRRRSPGQEGGVETVVAATGFPVSSQKRPRNSDDAKTAAAAASNSTATTIAQGHDNKKKKREKLLDWHETAREVRKLGATGFVKKQKRDYEDEEYKRLTGRERKRQHVPLPILKGMKRKRAQREATALAEAKAAGLVLPKSAKKESKFSRHNKGSSRSHGPAPSIGFVKKGVLQLKKKPV
eukprot:scaffold2688_cov157-Amphora_coffeaeformis.AAC.4